ncbi:helix-turn-helix domain-containing protein [Alkalicoccus urumqiensis]|uniref:DNA-binding protein n=1 Tax=Alkalicoccus urumqiensis TaxID=1548213 RepID=A0A2P6ME62_ALKUR|nr:helix-turn-helix domain-containing protein [Alkalicoccus urumqiensis]PRO64571.1 hypothetical protein C6I21_13825 [Alkalicoccus urumqiensis]
MNEQQATISLPIPEEWKHQYFQMFYDIASTAYEQAKNDVGEKRFLTKKEAASYIGISYNTLQSIIEEGLPLIQINSKNLIDREDIHKFLAGKKITY